MKTVLVLFISFIFSCISVYSQSDPPCADEYPCSSMIWEYDSLDFEIFRDPSCNPTDPCPIKAYFWKRSGNCSSLSNCPNGEVYEFFIDKICFDKDQCDNCYTNGETDIVHQKIWEDFSYYILNNINEIFNLGNFNPPYCVNFRQRQCMYYSNYTDDNNTEWVEYTECNSQDEWCCEIKYVLERNKANIYQITMSNVSILHPCCCELYTNSLFCYWTCQMRVPLQEEGTLDEWVIASNGDIQNLVNNQNSYIFPNPSSSELTIYYQNGFINTLVEIYSVDGKKVFSKYYNKNEDKVFIDSNYFPKGHYFYKILHNQDIKSTGSFIIE